MQRRGKLALIVKGKGIGLEFVEESYWSSNWFMNLSQEICKVVSGHSVVDNYHFSILERNNIIGLDGKSFPQWVSWSGIMIT